VGQRKRVWTRSPQRKLVVPAGARMSHARRHTLRPRASGRGLRPQSNKLQGLTAEHTAMVRIVLG
jgi:hypothetical protein